MFAIDTTVLNERIEQAKLASQILGRDVPITEIQVVDGITHFMLYSEQEGLTLLAGLEKDAKSRGFTFNTNDKKLERQVDKTLSQALAKSQVSSMLDNIFNKKVL
jgi:hypothetical protein